MDIPHFFRIATSSQHLIHPNKIDEGRYKKWDAKGVILFAVLTIATFGIAPVILLGTAASKLSRIKKEPADKEMASKVDQKAVDTGLKKSGPTQLSGNEAGGGSLGTDKNQNKTQKEKPLKDDIGKGEAGRAEDKPIAQEGGEEAQPAPKTENTFEQFSDRELKFIKDSGNRLKLHPTDQAVLKEEVAKINDDKEMRDEEKALAFQAKSNEAKKERKFLLAESYLIEAIKLKHAGSFLKLAEFYNVTTQQKKYAYECALLASIRGVPEADEKLGSILIRGSGFNDDPLEDQVFHLLPTITSQFNTDPAYRELSGNRSELEVVRLFKTIPPHKDPTDELVRKGLEAWDKEDFELAEKYFVTSAKFGNQKSFYHLGVLHVEMIEAGKVKEENKINQEYKLAKLCFEIAERAGDLDGTFALINLYRQGLGVKKDLDKALELLNKISDRIEGAKELADDITLEKALKAQEEKPKEIAEGLSLTFGSTPREGLPCIVLDTSNLSKSQHDALASKLSKDKLEVLEIRSDNEYGQTLAMKLGYFIYAKKYNDEEQQAALGAGEEGFDKGVTILEAYQAVQKASKELKIPFNVQSDALKNLNDKAEQCKEFFGQAELDAEFGDVNNLVNELMKELGEKEFDKAK